MSGPLEAIEAQRDRIYAAAEAADRDPADVGIHGRLRSDGLEGDELADRVDAWAALGADYLSVLPMGAGRSPDDHVRFLDAFVDILREVGRPLGG